MNRMENKLSSISKNIISLRRETMKKALIVLGLVFYGSLLADDGYKIPPKAIADLLSLIHI